MLKHHTGLRADNIEVEAARLNRLLIAPCLDLLVVDTAVLVVMCSDALVKADGAACAGIASSMPRTSTTSSPANRRIHEVLMVIPFVKMYWHNEGYFAVAATFRCMQ